MTRTQRRRLAKNAESVRIGVSEPRVCLGGEYRSVPHRPLQAARRIVSKSGFNAKRVS